MPYATIAEVERECAGIDLFRLGDAGVVREIMDDERDAAELRVEDITKRLSGAFNNNTDETISIDGTGLSTIRLQQYKYVPLISVSAISIDDEAQTMSDFAVYEDGRIEFAWSGSDTGTSTMGTLAEFSPGTQTIAITFDWGYTAVPERVKRATCLFAKAALLQRIAAALDKTEGAIPPGVRRYQIGEFSMEFPRGGQYGEEVKACKARAKELLGPYILNVVVSPRGRRAMRGVDTSDAKLAHYRTGA